jgi:hypothetical protein
MEPTAARDTAVPAAECLAITQELLGTLKDATRSGQYNLMQRVVSILERESRRPSLRLSESQLVALMTGLSELQHEAARVAPDMALFKGVAKVVLDILWIS